MQRRAGTSRCGVTREDHAPKNLLAACAPCIRAEGHVQQPPLSMPPRWLVGVARRFRPESALTIPWDSSDSGRETSLRLVPRRRVRHRLRRQVVFRSFLYIGHRELDFASRWSHADGDGASAEVNWRLSGFLRCPVVAPAPVPSGKSAAGDPRLVRETSFTPSRLLLTGGKLPHAHFARPTRD